MSVKCIWRMEENLLELVFSLSHVGPRDETQVVRLGGKHH